MNSKRYAPEQIIGELPQGEAPRSKGFSIRHARRNLGLTRQAHSFLCMEYGRVAASQGPAGGTLQVKVYWQGSQLVTEEGSRDGGRIVAIYTLLPPGETMLVRFRLQHKSLRKPLEVAMFFDRDEENE